MWQQIATEAMVASRYIYISAVILPTLETIQCQCIRFWCPPAFTSITFYTTHPLPLLSPPSLKSYLFCVDATPPPTMRLMWWLLPMRCRRWGGQRQHVATANDAVPSQMCFWIEATSPTFGRYQILNLCGIRCRCVNRLRFIAVAAAASTDFASTETAAAFLVATVFASKAVNLSGLFR